MKTLKDLESFRLGKGQMNAVTGGYNCYIVWALATKLMQQKKMNSRLFFILY
jgi:hypothetical protein